MKARTGFVSNSSASSFLVLIPKMDKAMREFVSKIPDSTYFMSRWTGKSVGSDIIEYVLYVVEEYYPDLYGAIIEAAAKHGIENLIYFQLSDEDENCPQYSDEFAPPYLEWPTIENNPSCIFATERH